MVVTTIILIYRKENKRNDSFILILNKQLIKDVENFHRDIAGFDKSSEEFNEIRTEPLKQEGYNFLHIDRSE